MEVPELHNTEGQKNIQEKFHCNLTLSFYSLLGICCHPPLEKG